MEASSSSSSSRAHDHLRKQARPHSDVFKPKFPIDPFLAVNAREPWLVRPERLPSAVTYARRDVILVLGAPSTRDLEPLLQSKHLANSLLLIATHQPPDISCIALPTVRVLRLAQPLAIEDAGAVRFVDVLEWAERVGRLWRKHGGYGAIELSENDDGHEHMPPPRIFGFQGSQSTPPSPRASSVLLSSDAMPARPRSASARFLSKARAPSLPAVDPSQRPFDAIINFLPKDTPAKALLKQAILVTTISRPFLVATVSRPAEDINKRRSLFSSRSSRSLTSVYIPLTPPYNSGDSLCSPPPGPVKPHLLHLLPTDTRSPNSYARSKLIQSLESFLLSYAAPTTFDTDDCLERARPYIMGSHSLGETLNSGPTFPSPDCTLADLVLCGALDGESSAVGIGRGVTVSAPLTRAWLSGASDVVIAGSDDIPMNALVMPPPEAACGRHGRLLHSASSSTSSYGASRDHQYQGLNQYGGESFGMMAMSASAPGSSPLGLGMQKTKRYSSLGWGGLPTPPDSSEESGGSPRSEGRRVSLETEANGKVIRGVGRGKAKTRKFRWRFWRDL